MSIHTLPPKDPEERVPVTFDFTDEMSSTDSVITATVTLDSVVEGVDIAPNVIDGAAQISGKQVVQWMKLGLDTTTYRFKCAVTTTEGRTLVLRTLLPVVRELA